MARFSLPARLKIQLLDSDGTPFTRFPVPVIVSYGYLFPPLLSDTLGQIVITKEMFAKAESDTRNADLMGTRWNEYSLARFVRVRILDRDQGLKMAQARSSSRWPISAYEKELYHTLPALLAAYVPQAEISGEEVLADLEPPRDDLDIHMLVRPH